MTSIINKIHKVVLSRFLFGIKSMAFLDKRWTVTRALKGNDALKKVIYNKI